jgi:uncharacterized phage-associated protein
MPGWSPEIANEFIKIAARENRAFDQMQLQWLVYIAHGWCLALYDEPLTGDRPEAWEFGPEYRRLADALAPCGCDPVTHEIHNADAFPDFAHFHADDAARAELEWFECELVLEIYKCYGSFERSKLASLACEDNAPWRQVFADGTGKFREISHGLVKAEFLEIRHQLKNADKASVRVTAM